MNELQGTIGRNERVGDESIEKERQRRLECWDEDDTLADYPTVFAAIRSYIGQGLLDPIDMRIIVKTRKNDIIKWFSDKQYSEALPMMLQEFGLTKVELRIGLEKTPQEMINLARELEKFEKIEVVNEDEIEVIKELRSSYRNFYNENLYTSEVNDSFFDLVSCMMKNHDITSQYRSLVPTIEEFLIRAKGPEELAALLQGTKYLAESGNMDGISIILGYYQAHDFDKEKLKAFIETVIPMMKQNDPEVSILDRKDGTGGTAFSWRYGQYGAADYVVAALISKITPSNVNELLCAEREVPTSDLNKFERNRLDALELEGVLYGNRDFIHDNMPGVHELLKAMLDYFDSRYDEQEHNKSAERLRNIVDNLTNNVLFNSVYLDLDKYVFDLSHYEQRVVKRDDYLGGLGSNYELASDVLRRLVRNTANSLLEKPKTTDEELNQLIKNLDVRANETTGEIYADWRQTGELVKYINNYLVQHQGDIGIRPSMISAISYAEKMATHAMKHVSDKDWHELLYDPHFKEFMRLQELIGSNYSYNESQFDEFYNGLIRKISKDFESDEVIRETYKELAQHILEKLRELAVKYNSNPNTTYRAGALWSGNLVHELIGLADK